MKLSGLSFLDLYKGPYKAGGKAANFLGLYPQDDVGMKKRMLMRNTIGWQSQIKVQRLWTQSKGGF